MPELRSIAADLAREVKLYGHCRQPLHSTKPCECGHCRALAAYELWKARTEIVQEPKKDCEKCER